MIEKNPAFWGVFFAGACLFTLIAYALICWIFGLSILLKSWEDTLSCLSVPTGELVASIVCFITFGIRKLIKN